MFCELYVADPVPTSTHPAAVCFALVGTQQSMGVCARPREHPIRAQSLTEPLRRACSCRLSMRTGGVSVGCSSWVKIEADGLAGSGVF